MWMMLLTVCNADCENVIHCSEWPLFQRSSILTIWLWLLLWWVYQAVSLLGGRWPEDMRNFLHIDITLQVVSDVCRFTRMALIFFFPFYAQHTSPVEQWSILDLTLFQFLDYCKWEHFQANLDTVLFAATTAERFFRIDQAHEHLHYATDIFSEELFIVYVEVNQADAAASSNVISVQPDQHLNHHTDYDNTSTDQSSMIWGISDISGSGHRPLHRTNAKRNIAATSKTSQ